LKKFPSDPILPSQHLTLNSSRIKIMPKVKRTASRSGSKKASPIATAGETKKGSETRPRKVGAEHDHVHDFFWEIGDEMIAAARNS
jgi:hypothetical protein